MYDSMNGLESKNEEEDELKGYKNKLQSDSKQSTNILSNESRNNTEISKTSKNSSLFFT